MGNFIHRYLNNSLIVGILLYLLLYVFLWNKATMASLAGLVALTTNGFLLLFYYNRGDDYFTSVRLVSITFVYSLLVVGLFFFISDFYDGDTYLFSKNDAFQYRNQSFKMVEMSFFDSIDYINRTVKDFDDRGAPIAMSTILRIIPSKLFLNFVNILLGTLGAYFLFGIGCYLMNKKEAFIASFLYSSSSFVLFLHGTFAKESIFLFLVIGMFYYFYKFLETKILHHVLIMILFSAAILFFRPAVSLFFYIGITFYYLTDKNNILISFSILLTFLALLIGTSMVVAVYDRYTMGGDISGLTERRMEEYGTGLFGYITNWVVAFIGPFPTVLSNIKHATVLYAPGLFLKMIISLPFLMGMIYILRYRIRKLYPIAVFCLVEMISLAMILQSFEFRKGLPHYPFIYIIAFWYLSIEGKDGSLFRRFAPIWLTIVAIIGLGWNLLR